MIPVAPAQQRRMSEEELASTVTPDSTIGVALPDATLKRRPSGLPVKIRTGVSRTGRPALSGSRVAGSTS